MSLEVNNSMFIGAAAEWDRICSQTQPTAAELTADMLRDGDDFAETIYEHLFADYYTKRQRHFAIAALSSDMERKHDRAAKAVRALQAIANAKIDSLTENERAIRVAIVEAFTERAKQIVEDGK